MLSIRTGSLGKWVFSAFSASITFALVSLASFAETRTLKGLGAQQRKALLRPGPHVEDPRALRALLASSGRCEEAARQHDVRGGQVDPSKTGDELRRPRSGNRRNFS